MRELNGAEIIHFSCNRFSGVGLRITIFCPQSLLAILEVPKSLKRLAPHSDEAATRGETSFNIRCYSLIILHRYAVDMQAVVAQILFYCF